jgi:FixJ family two-component response regulator
MSKGRQIQLNARRPPHAPSACGVQMSKRRDVLLWPESFSAQNVLGPPRCDLELAETKPSCRPLETLSEAASENAHEATNVAGFGEINASGDDNLNKPNRIQDKPGGSQDVPLSDEQACLPLVSSHHLAPGTADAPDGSSDINSGPTVFVVDDNRLAREAIRVLLLDTKYRVETYPSARDFLESYRPGETGCLITDVRMPDMDGFELLAQLATTGDGLPAIVITGQGDIATAVQAMKAGAVDFIEKPINPDALLTCIGRALLRVESPTERSARRSAAAMRIASLTAREREVMDLVVAGHANKEIAYRLGISQRTVETHRAAVMKKMGAASLADLIRLEMAAQ